VEVREVYKMRFAILLLMLMVLPACGPTVKPMGDMITAKGKLSKGGAPVGNVTLTLQPLGNGHLAPLAVGTDGAFQGSLVPGKYAWFVGKSEAAESKATLESIDPKFYEADMGRTVEVKEGEDLKIDL
jgi:hypothetical protein